MTAHPNAPRPGAAGFTLLELLVVLSVMGLIAAVVTPQVMNMLAGAKTRAATLQVESLVSALDYYQLDVGAYPTTEQGLAALHTRPPNTPGWRGPYVRKKQHLLDPWGRAFVYRAPAQKGAFEVLTLGADGKEGGSGDDADVSSLDEK
ncbi:MAG: type secretion system major pseudopilin GspG [Pseudomonadota bacterium]|jgi:general secretion pathway protein G